MSGQLVQLSAAEVAGGSSQCLLQSLRTESQNRGEFLPPPSYPVTLRRTQPLPAAPLSACPPLLQRTWTCCAPAAATWQSTSPTPACLGCRWWWPSTALPQTLMQSWSWCARRRSRQASPEGGAGGGWAGWWLGLAGWLAGRLAGKQRSLACGRVPAVACFPPLPVSAQKSCFAAGLLCRR